MKLASPDGTCVDIRPLAYQFPDREPDRRRVAGEGIDWDANWLVVRCEVRMADGREWIFANPCLTTWEADDLADWLGAVAAGEILPQSGPPDTGSGKCFTEPVIAFGLERQDAGRSRLRIYFSLEGLPPGMVDPRPSLYEWWLVVDLDDDDLADAAREWQRECAGFPRR